MRLIDARDADQLGELFAELAGGPEAQQFHPHPLTRPEAVRIASGDPARLDLYFAAFVGDRLVGYGMLRGWDEGYGIPSFGVAVRKGYRDRGIGRAMLLYSIDLAREKGAATMMLKVHRDNPGAIHLYESVGFAFEETEVDLGQLKGLLAL
jgi:ribosomal-protein-alanine N-acetyltransferase